MFRFVASDQFPPFGQFHIAFPEVENKPDDAAEVHLFTGVNGSGKTRLLALLAAALGNPQALLERLPLPEPDRTIILGNTHDLAAGDRQKRTPHFKITSGNLQWQIPGTVMEWAAKVPAFA